MASTQTTDAGRSSTSEAKSRKPKKSPPTTEIQAQGAGPLALESTLADPASATPGAILQLQRTAGNKAVRRLLAQRRVQARLTVGPAGDRYEQEADNVAHQVMTQAAPAQPSPAQRKDEEDGAGLQRFPAAPTISNLRPGKLQNKEAAPADPRAGFEADAGVERQLSVIQGRGRPLPAGTRSFMESRFGQGFGGVRVHTGPDSNQLNRQLSAQAFTHGRDIYFGEGKYDPGTGSGKALLAHELTHVVQQGGADVRRSPLSPYGTAQESRFTKVNRLLVQREDDEDDEDDEDSDTDEESEELTPESLGSKIGSRYSLTADSDKALKAASAANAGRYSLIAPVVKAYVPESNQKKINDVQGFFQRVSGRNKDFRDYLRAYLLKEYAQVVYNLYTNPEYTAKYTTDKAREQRRDKVYLPKALRERDKFKPLLKMGITAPETRAFVESEGFEAALPLNDQEKAAQIGTGPKIDVRSTFIGGPVLGINLRAHLFIVYTNSEGRQFYYRGGPGEDVDDGHGGTISYTSADMGPYTPGTVDWDPSAPSKTILSGDKAKAKADALAEAATVIDPMKVPYEAVRSYVKRDGENCNTTVWTILDRAGLPKQKPTGIHPGWGHVLGEAFGRGTNKIAPAEEDAPKGSGLPQIIEAAGGDQAQIYADRAGAEKLTMLPNGTRVEFIRDTRHKDETNYVKIRFADDKVGFVETEDLSTPEGKKYIVKGDGSHLVVVYESSSFRPSSDVLAGGDEVGVLEDFDPSADPKPVRIAYMAGGELKMGRVSSAELEEPKAPVTPSFTPAQYPAGDHPFGPLTAPLKMMGAVTPDGKLDYEVEYFTGDTFVAKITDDMTTNHGRCEVSLFSTKYYVPLDSLFEPLEEEPDEVEDLAERYAHIPLGRPSLQMPAGKRMRVYPDYLKDESARYDYVFDADRTLRILVADDLKEKGICKVDVMGTGKYFYALLDDLFDKSGRPSADVGSGSGVEEPDEDLSDVSEDVDEHVLDDVKPDDLDELPLSQEAVKLLAAGADLQMLIYGNQADAETFKELNARQVDQLAKIMGSSVESVISEIEGLI